MIDGAGNLRGGGMNECVQKVLRGFNFVGFFLFKIVCLNTYS